MNTPEEKPTLREIQDSMLELAAEGLIEPTGDYRPGADGSLRPVYRTTPWGKRCGLGSEGEDPVLLSRRLRQELKVAGKWRTEWDTSLPPTEVGPLSRDAGGLDDAQT